MDIDTEHLGWQERTEILLKCLNYNYQVKKFHKNNPNPFESNKLIKVHKDFNNICKGLDSDLIEVDKIIVITGAGLSHEAGLPTGKATSDHLMEMLTGKNGVIDKSYLEHRIEEIRLENGQKKADFESIIEAMCEHKSTEERVKKELTKLFEMKNYPLIGYEILAHWLKHRVIDGIINFNFDELLDESIEEEFIHDEYIRVIGGGDYADPRLHRDKLNYPIYIKPHGTVSDPDSFRATREDYLRTTSGFQNILRNLLKEGKVLFLTIGYNMQSIELNELLQEQMTNSLNAKFFVLKRSAIEISKFPLISKSTTVLTPPFPNRNDYGGKFIENINNQLTTHIENEHKIFLENNEEGALDYHPLLKLQDITKHEINSKYFANIDHVQNEQDDINRYEYHVYYYLRTLIELAISIAKSGGFINLFSMFNGRLGRMYKKYYMASQNKKSLAEFCDELGLIQSTYTKEYWVLVSNEGLSLEKCWSDKDKLKKLFNQLTEKVSEKVDDLKNEIESIKDYEFKEAQINLIKKFKGRFDKNNFTHYLMKYVSRNNYEIGHPFASGWALTYKLGSYKELYSWEHLKNEFLRLSDLVLKDVKNSQETSSVEFDYQIAYVTTFGRYLSQDWLTNSIQAIQSKKSKTFIQVIVHNLPESFANKDKIKDSLKKTINVQSMNWWSNNRNIILFLRRPKGGTINDFEPRAVIYYYRGRTTRRISPISISLDNDVNNDLKAQKLSEKYLELKTEYLKSIYTMYMAYALKTKNRKEEDIGTFFGKEKENAFELIKNKYINLFKSNEPYLK